MIRKIIETEIFETADHETSIVRIKINEQTHLGLSGYVFDLTAAEADELQGKIVATLRRTREGGGGRRNLAPMGILKRDPLDNEEKDHE